MGKWIRDIRRQLGYKTKPMNQELFEGRLSAPVCPVQEARRKGGLAEYACRATHEAEFNSFARAIDPFLRVGCRFAPPNPQAAGMHCQWRFSYEGCAMTRRRI